MLYKAFAFFAAGAAVAAPAVQPQKRQQYPASQSVNWQATWAAEQASMVSVLHAMASPGYRAQAPAPYNPPPAPAVSSANPYVGAGGSLSSTAAPSLPSAPPVISTSAAPAVSSAQPSQPSSSSASSYQGQSNPGSSSGGGGNGQKITNPKAFEMGVGVQGGKASGGVQAQDAYKCYGGKPSDYPSKDQWASWESMWAGGSQIIPESCTNLGYGAPVTQQQVDMIKTGIESVASETNMDARAIFAVMLQESKGCVNVGATNNGVSNPGLMQSHSGVSFVGGSAPQTKQQDSITQMIRDGVQGTASGPGLIQGINKFGDLWTAARAYNSGCANTNNLNDGISSTGNYVNGIANYMTGWVKNPPTAQTCPGECRSGQASCDVRMS